MSAGAIPPGRKAFASAVKRARSAWWCSTTTPTMTTRCSTAWRARWSARFPVRWWRAKGWSWNPDLSPMRVLGWIEDLAKDLQAIGADSPPAPRWNQDWFPRLDAVAAYAIVRMTRPRRVVEVGSGHSTRFLARAVADGALETQITCIDPAPRASIAALRIRHLACRVQDVDVALFRALMPGDILFVDSSHQVKPGSDVDFLMAQVLPIP